MALDTEEEQVEKIQNIWNSYKYLIISGFVVFFGFYFAYGFYTDQKIKKTEDEQLHVWKGALDEGCLMLTYQLGFLTDKLKLNDIKKMLKIVARDGTSEAVVDLIVNKVLSN